MAKEAAKEAEEKNARSALRERLQQENAERFVHRTFRTDWKDLTSELFRMVIHDVPFAVGMATKHRGTFTSSL